jgi:hypothetical protein
MTNQLTPKQIEWAKSHDWFAGMIGDCIEVVDRWVNVNTKESGEDLIIWTKSFRELRDWAGY